MRTNIIYFDFQKAFDSVNHDVFLEKLKQQYKIDGSLLRFLNVIYKTVTREWSLEIKYKTLSALPQETPRVQFRVLHSYF